VLWRLPRPRVRVIAPGWQVERRTTCLFIANNLYRLDAFASAKRVRLDQGDLCLYMANGGGRLTLLYLAVRAFLGRLEPDRDFVLAQLKSVDISAHRRRLRVALDGESLLLRPPLHYRIRPRALRVIVPGPA
jgi:diacylglycerol kinase family enzyme